MPTISRTITVAQATRARNACQSLYDQKVANGEIDSGVLSLDEFVIQEVFRAGFQRIKQLEKQSAIDSIVIEDYD